MIIDELIQLARQYAAENMNSTIEPAHLFRASLHPDMGLVDVLETTLSKDYYYFVEWADAQMSILDKTTKAPGLELSDLSEAVIREADNYRDRTDSDSNSVLCILASLVTPGVGFSFEQLKTLPLTVQEILPLLEKDDVKTNPTREKNKVTGLHSATKYCIDLIDLAKKSQWTIVGFENEISTMFEVFGRQNKANVLVTGDSGVGKTSLIRGFVNRILNGQVPAHLQTAHVFELNINELAAGTSYKSEIGERAKKVLEELTKFDNVILTIESIDKIMDKQDSLYGVVNSLMQAIELGDISILCTSTIDGFTRAIENNKEFVNKLERITLDPPTDEQCFRIVRGSIGKYETFHQLEVPDEVIHEAIRLAKKYIAERPLPDSVFDLMDRTMSQIVIMNGMAINDITELKQRLNGICISDLDADRQLDWIHYEIFNKISCLLTMRVENEKDYSKCESSDEKKQYLTQVLAELEQLASEKRTSVQTSDLSSVVAKSTGIPMGKVQSGERERLINGESILKQRVIGQDHAIKVVLDAVYESRSGLNKKGQPMGSFFFLGPTGTGKTELSKALVEFLFGDESALVRFDMSEFKEEHSVALLYGAPPGYVGYE